jgi:probable HAF family extracellular repeat protein
VRAAYHAAMLAPVHNATVRRLVTDDGLSYAEQRVIAWGRFLWLPDPDDQIGPRHVSCKSIESHWRMGEGINDSEQVTGTSDIAVNDVHAFLYSGGTMLDLNLLVVAGLDGATLIDAQGINNVGQIVALGCTPTHCRAFRLDPLANAASPTSIPTLSNLALSVVAILLLGVELLRRRHLRTDHIGRVNLVYRRKDR